jgi:hypothetical protein
MVLEGKVVTYGHADKGHAFDELEGVLNPPMVPSPFETAKAFTEGEIALDNVSMVFRR